MTADDGQFPDGSAVETPLTPEQRDGPRDAWPWLPGTVLSRCGPDEWQVMVEARELATLVPAYAAAACGDLWPYPRAPSGPAANRGRCPS